MDFAQFRLMDHLRLFVAVLALSVVVGISEDAHADGPMGNDFGLGFAAGNPSTFNGKHYLGGDTAVDFHLGVYKAYRRSFYDDSLFLAGDYLFEVWNFAETGAVSVPFYAGPGLALLLDLDDGYCDSRWDRDICRNHYDFGFGPRMPIGVALQFQKAPFEIFLEMSPTLLILTGHNDTRLDIDIVNFALGGRFYF
ncbi:MAG: hypothetical protein ACLFVJ_05230 [Persicimonas sp.]